MPFHTAYTKTLPISLIAALGLTGCAIQTTSSGYSFYQDTDALFGKMLRDYTLPEGGTATLRQGADRRQYSLKLNSSLHVIELGQFDLAVPEFDTTLNEAGGKQVRMIILRTRNTGCETHYVAAEIRDKEATVRTIGNCEDTLIFSAAEERELQMRNSLDHVYTLVNGVFSGPFVATKPAASTGNAPATKAEQQSMQKSSNNITTAPHRAPKRSTSAPAPTDLPRFKSVEFDRPESRAPSNND